MTNSKKIFLIAPILFFLTLLVPFETFAEFKKTKIAVLDFSLQGRQNDTTDIGKIVAEWLITALVKEGRFDVIERRLLEKVLQEQKMGASGIVDSDSASKLGKVLGAKVVITGSVLEFQNILEVNARIIEVESSSIIAAESVKSTSTVKLEDLVFDMAQKIIKDFPLEGYVVSRDGKNVLLDLGLQAGVKNGMKFIVFKEGRIIKHPKTGEILDIETVVTGEVEITDVGKKTSKAIVVKETSPEAIVYGLMVRSALPGQLVNIEEERDSEQRIAAPEAEPVQSPRKKDVSAETSQRRVNIPAPTF